MSTERRVETVAGSDYRPPAPRPAERRSGAVPVLTAAAVQTLHSGAILFAGLVALFDLSVIDVGYGALDRVSIGIAAIFVISSAALIPLAGLVVAGRRWAVRASVALQGVETFLLLYLVAETRQGSGPISIMLLVSLLVITLLVIPPATRYFEGIPQPGRPQLLIEAGRFVALGSDQVRRGWAATGRPVRWAAYAALVVGALLLPSQSIGSFMTPQSDWATVLFYPIGVFILLAIGLNVVVGQAGLLDLGYVAFFAIGGYMMAVLGTEWGWNFWEILVVGVLASALSGVILGAPTLRLRGDYLAIVTLGFGEIVRITAQNTDSIGGPRGIAGIPHPPTISEFDIFGVQPFRYGVLDPRPYYYLLVILIVLTIIFARRLDNSRVGRAWAAIREDEDAAELMGVPTFRFKLAAFAIGAAIGGAAGVAWSAKVISIIPNNFPFILSATILAAVVLGGSGNIPGVMLGAFLIAWVPERFRGFQDYRVFAFGAALVLVMALRPEGLLPSRRRKAEFAEGTGGMGSMGAEVGEPGGPTVAEARS